MDAIPSQYQTIAKAGIAGGVAAVAAGLLQSGTSPLVPIFVGGTVVAITHFALTGIEKTQLAARKALKKASKSDKKSKADTKSDKKGKKSDKKSEDEEEQPEEVEEQPVEPKKAGKKQPKKEEKKPAGKKEEAKKAPKAEEKKAAPKAAAKQAAAPAPAPAPAAAPKKGAKAEAKAAAPAKAPAKAAPKAEAKKAAKVEAAPKKGAKAEAPAPEAKAAKNKKKKAPKVVEPVEEPEDDDEEEEQEGWITQKTKARKPSEKATARVPVKQQEEEDDEEEKEEGPKEETVTFSLPRASHAAIFGEKGNTIAKIQQVSGTRVKMPAKESKEDTITIRGSGDGIKLAQQIMQDVATQGFSTVLNPNLVKVEINVPSEKQGGLIGKAGENIRLIQQKTDTKITIPKKEDKSRIITIVGPPEGVKAAQDAIKSILAHGFADITHPDHVKETISIPRDQTRLLIGPGGATIKAIQTSSNVKINIPDSETEEQKRHPYQVLTITGPAPNVRAAKNAILMSMQPLEDEAPDANSPWAGSMDYSEDAQWE